MSTIGRLVVGGAVVAAGAGAVWLYQKNKNAATSSPPEGGGSTGEPPAQALPFDWSAVVAAVGAEESGNRWDALNPNDRAAGVSFGLIQFNQRAGSLGMVLQQFRTLDPAGFLAIWGGGGDNVVAMLTSALPAQRMIPDLAHDPLAAKLRATAATESGRTAQLDVAWSLYAAPLVALATQAGMDQTAEFGLVFDRSVNQGPGLATAALGQAIGAVNAGRGWPDNVNAFGEWIISKAAPQDKAAIRARMKRVYNRLGGVTEGSQA